jgi:opacity protein-like surface antigen
MNHMRGLAAAIVVGFFLILAPVTAAADVLLTPYAGFSRLYEENKGTFGVTFGFGGLIGLEFDAARIQLGVADDVALLDLEAHATTLMGNVVVRLPAGPLQPYGSAGIGLVRVTGEVDVPVVGNIVSVDAQDLGWNIGGGVYVLPSRNFGLRADVRRFQTGDVTFDDIIDIGGIDDLPLPNFNFWRTTVGVTFKF